MKGGVSVVYFSDSDCPSFILPTACSKIKIREDEAARQQCTRPSFTYDRHSVS